MSVYRPTHRCNLLNTSVELTDYEIEFRVQALLRPFFKLRSGSSDIRKAFIGKIDFCPLIAMLYLSISC
jgi:hypothetical protein